MVKSSIALLQRIKALVLIPNLLVFSVVILLTFFSIGVEIITKGFGSLLFPSYYIDDELTLPLVLSVAGLVFYFLSKHKIFLYAYLLLGMVLIYYLARFLAFMFIF